MSWEGEDIRGGWGGKEELRKRGQVMRAEILRVGLSKLLQKILHALHVPEQGWEHAERMTQAALHHDLPLCAKPGATNYIIFCGCNTEESFPFTQ